MATVLSTAGGNSAKSQFAMTCFGGGGSRKLLSHDSPISSDEVHRQACIPVELSAPMRNTPPDSNVPNKRPAALAM